MASHPVDFAALSWKDEGPGIRTLETEAAGSRWAIVEYGPRASRDEWCTDGHRGYVIEGAMEYELDDGSAPLAFQAGQGFVLGAGTGHRGRNPTDVVTRLFLIDDPG